MPVVNDADLRIFTINVALSLLIVEYGDLYDPQQRLFCYHRSHYIHDMILLITRPDDLRVRNSGAFATIEVAVL